MQSRIERHSCAILTLTQNFAETETYFNLNGRNLVLKSVQELLPRGNNSLTELQNFICLETNNGNIVREHHFMEYLSRL